MAEAGRRRWDAPAWTPVVRGTDAGPVRALVAGPRDGTSVVLVPGLGALGYLRRLVGVLTAYGARVTLLDLPGFGSDAGPRCRAAVGPVSVRVAGWCAQDPPEVLVGHSTGAQAVLRVVADEGVAGRAVALGLPFPPWLRDGRRVAVLGPWAYRRDSLGELVASRDEYLRGGWDVVGLLRSGLAARPEDDVRRAAVPLVLASGRHDSLSPHAWRDDVARQAGSGADVADLPGSHNVPWTHPAAVAGVILGLTPRTVT